MRHQGTIDLLGRRMAAHEKAAWMLRSILETPMAPAPPVIETPPGVTSWVPMSMAFGEYLWAHGIVKAVSRDDLGGGVEVMSLPHTWETMAKAEWTGKSMEKAGTGQPKPGAKYIKRVPTGNPRRPWKYFYAVQHGGGVANKEHMVEGASFKHGDGHFHIHGVKDGKLIVSHGEGEKKHMTHEELASKLAEHHGKAIAEHKTKLLGEIEDARKAGNVKSVERLTAEAKKAGYEPQDDRRARMAAHNKKVAEISNDETMSKKAKKNAIAASRNEYLLGKPADSKPAGKAEAKAETKPGAGSDGFYAVPSWDGYSKRYAVKHSSEMKPEEFEAKSGDEKAPTKHETYDKAHEHAVTDLESRIRQAQRLLDGKSSFGELTPDERKKVDARVADEKAHIAALHAEKAKRETAVSANDNKAAKPAEKPEHPDAWSGGAPRTDAQLEADGYVKGADGAWTKKGQADDNKPESTKPAKGESDVPTAKVEHSIPNSTNLERVSWEPAKPGEGHGVMRVHFKNGSAYDYKDVPHDHYKNIVNAGSPGEAFNDRVKGKYESTKIRAAGTDTGSRADGPVRTPTKILDEQAAERKVKSAEKQKQSHDFVKDRDARALRAVGLDKTSDKPIDMRTSSSMRNERIGSAAPDHVARVKRLRDAVASELEDKDFGLDNEHAAKLHTRQFDVVSHPGADKMSDDDIRKYLREGGTLPKSSGHAAKLAEKSHAESTKTPDQPRATETESAKTEQTKPTHADLVNNAKKTYGFTDAEAEKVHARSLKHGADKHVAEGRHEEAQNAVKQAVKEHLTLSRERGLSPSKAHKYMESHEAAEAKKSMKKAFGEAFLSLASMFSVK